MKDCDWEAIVRQIAKVHWGPLKDGDYWEAIDNILAKVGLNHDQRPGGGEG